MRIVEPNGLAVRDVVTGIGDYKKAVAILVEQPCGYGDLPEFDRTPIITCDRTIVVVDNYRFKGGVAAYELAAFKRPVICVRTEIMTLITERMPHPNAGYAYVDLSPARVSLMTSTGKWGTPIVQRIGNPIFADAIVSLLWWAWLREESQYGDIILRPWGPVSRVPIPESIWGVYDVLPPPAGSDAALLLDHHNKFRTT